MSKLYFKSASDFSAYGKWNPEGRYYFQDNGANILAIAHLDYVGINSHFKYVELPFGDIIFSPVHDDRLGVFVILELLKKSGIKYDVLLTIDEEQGRSTAVNFKSPKQYNWMFQFDRAGTDVVMYQYDNKELRKLLQDCSFQPSFGSYSDICELDHLGCKGFNVGTSYYENHTVRSYALVDGLNANIAKFLNFYDKNKDTHLIHNPVSREDYWKGWYNTGTTLIDDDDDISSEHFYCNNCMEAIDYVENKSFYDECPYCCAAI